VEQAGFKSFSAASRTIQNHYTSILNFFDNRSTNTSAESFNAKMKAFRAQFRGVTNGALFLFRVAMLKISPHRNKLIPEIQTDPPQLAPQLKQKIPTF
jgi:hypothetical protein